MRWQERENSGEPQFRGAEKRQRRKTKGIS
jgi:hypothetical protein